MTDDTSKLDESLAHEAATQRLSVDDHEDTVRLGDEDEEEDHSASQTQRLDADVAPRPQARDTPSRDKLKALLDKSRQLSTPSANSTGPEMTDTAPSLASLEDRRDTESDPLLDALSADEAESSERPATPAAPPTVPAVDRTRPEIQVPPEMPDVTSGLLEELDDGSSDAGEAVKTYASEDATVMRRTPGSGESAAQPAEYQLQEPLNPSGDYGVLPGIGENSRSGEHATERSVNRDPRRVVIAIVAVGCFAVVICSVLVVQNWLNPTRGMVWIGAAALASTLLMGLIAPWEHDGGTRQGVLVRVVPGLMFTCVAVMFSALWSIGSVRAFAVDFVPDELPLMERILDDPADQVAAAGCERYSAHQDDPRWWGRMLTIISSRPGAAANCLRDLDTERQASITGSLLDRWGRELLADGGPQTAPACEISVALTKLPVDPSITSAPLLDCTLSAEDEKTQACCSEALASTVADSKQWATRLSKTARWIEGDETPSGVFSMAFRPQGLTPPQKKFAEQVKFDGVMGRGAALALVCETMEQDPENVMRHLTAVLDGECPLSVGKLPRKVELWAPICEATKTEVEADRTRPPVATLCEITTDAVVPDAIETARRLLNFARVQDDEGLADSVDAGYAFIIANPDENSLNVLSPQERRAAMMEKSQGRGTVVFMKSIDQHQRESYLDEQSRKELHEWEDRVAERMRKKKR